MDERRIKLEFLKKQNESYTIDNIVVKGDTAKVYAMCNLQCFEFTYKIQGEELKYVTHKIMDYTDYLDFTIN